MLDAEPAHQRLVGRGFAGMGQGFHAHGTSPNQVTWLGTHINNQTLAASITSTTNTKNQPNTTTPMPMPTPTTTTTANYNKRGLRHPGYVFLYHFYFKLIVYWHNNSTTTISITTTIYETWQHQVQRTTTTASQRQSMKLAQPTRARRATTAQPPCHNRPQPPTTDHGQMRTWVEGYMMRVDKYTKTEMIIFWDQHASECFFYLHVY